MGKILKLGFTGDFSFEGFFIQNLKSGIATFSTEIVNFLEHNDYNIFNIEGPITNAPSNKLKGVALSSDPLVIGILKALKCNVFGLANNHIMDCGVEGLKDTLNLAKDHHILYFGAGKEINEASQPVVLQNGHTKVALLGMCHCEGQIADQRSPGVFCDRFESHLKMRIKESKRHCDWVVLVYHGGEEYTYYPMPKRREKLIKYLNYGVDIIVCHHAHTVQGYEVFGNKYIFYSLGNFVFDMDYQYTRDGACYSVLLSLGFQKKLFTFNYLLTKIDRENRVVKPNHDHTNFGAIDNRNYPFLWNRDAARLIFSRINNNKANCLNNQFSTKASNNLSSPKLCLNIEVFKALCIYLRQPNLRPILFSALQYELSKRLPLIFNYPKC